ncbi:hypothetical protein EJ110_NYTH47024 [Nymphaea thermarum]|nr:hypothetical protein EJ110_NYTH47024 [Nymphaea thermarum]
MEPSSHAEGIARRETSEGKADWWRSRCPPGTVPVPRSPSPISPFFTSKFVDQKGFVHEHAYLYERGVFHGTKARFNVWSPQTEGQSGEFSLAQLWVLNDGNSSDMNSIEAGWHVYPSLNGDSQPRLFVYWTRDNYGSTGCYNLKCPGFVQVSDQISPGMAISPVSAYQGEQLYIDLLVFKDAKTGNWWLQYNDVNVGYWPSSLFTTLADSANLLEWGGEVARPANGPRLATKMGSGHFPSEGGDGISSSVKNIECLNATTNAFVQPTDAVAVAKVKNCYDINNVGSTATDGYVIYFGGPGKSDTYGELIDCIDIYSQPAFGHPALKNHTIQHAIIRQLGSFSGTKARFNVWNPHTEEQDEEFSLAQLWVVNDADASNLNTIEVGWHNDSYGSTGCYNLKCPGFVQVSDQISPGMPISPVSAYQGEQVYIDLLVFKDAETGNWWLKYEDMYVGYWPGSLFTTLANEASRLDWGGEVARPANGPRLATEMGSGHFPSEGGDGISCSVKNIECLDATTNAFVQPTAAVPIAKVRYCYDINNVGSTATDGYVIYFGGPGKSDICQ